MDSADTWRWIWLVAAVVLVVGEVSISGTFFLAPFAIGALAAAGLAFAGVSVPWEWLAFVVTSAAACAVLWPLSRRLDRATPTGAGARRLIGEAAVVLTAIESGPAGHGLIQVGREEWNAESADRSPIPAGAEVTIVEVRGTRAIVQPVSVPGSES